MTANRATACALLGGLAIWSLHPVVSGQLVDILRRMEDEVIGFRDYIEEKLETERCQESTFSNCFQNQYDTCRVEYPSQLCPISLGPGTLLNTPECQGTGLNDAQCNGLFMFKHSSFQVKDGVGLNEFGEITAKAMESICFGSTLEEHMIERYKNISDYWSTTLGVDEVPYVYLGMADSSFRIYPSRQHNITDCDSYDPRIRPWYKAARSGLKDVILILDSSGSTRQKVWEVVRATAFAVLDSLNDHDRVGIVRMDANPSLLRPTDFPDILALASAPNKNKLKRVLRTFEAPSGQADVVGAFEVAYDVLNRTIEQELHSQCNVAILLITEGGIRQVDSVIELIQEKNDDIQAETKKRPMIFTYAVETADDASESRRLACGTNSLWAKVGGVDKVEESLSGYYKYFAFGHGEDRRSNVNWVDPYPFATSENFGTTVSSPVYDRKGTLPVFVGVVGIDISVAAMDQAIPGQKGQRFIVDAINSRIRSNRVCPSVELTSCQMESLRRETLEDFSESVCSGVCTNETDVIPLELEVCPYHTSKASYEVKTLLENTRNEGLSFEERICCIEGESDASASCARVEAPSLSPTELPFDTSNPDPSTPTSTPTTPSPSSRLITTAPLAVADDLKPSPITTSDDGSGNDIWMIVAIVCVAVVVVLLVLFVASRKLGSSGTANVPSTVGESGGNDDVQFHDEEAEARGYTPKLASLSPPAGESSRLSLQGSDPMGLESRPMTTSQGSPE